VRSDGGEEAARRVIGLLRGVPGIVAARALARPELLRVAAVEERYGSSALLPVLNLGVREALERQLVVAVLKDRRFRPPPAPTVYLVEDLPGVGPAPDAPMLEVGERRFRILGEEILDPGRVYAEKSMRLGSAFVLFPERRSSPRTPSYFLVPPLGFEELEQAAGKLGLQRILSVSPSAQADSLLRELCGFPVDPALATLLLACDLRT